MSSHSSKHQLICFSHHSTLQQHRPKPVCSLFSYSHDYVEVYNGGDELSPSMGKFCGKVAPPLMTSSGNQLLIKFVTDNENHGGGFSVQYEVFKTGV